VPVRPRGLLASAEARVVGEPATEGGKYRRSGLAPADAEALAERLRRTLADEVVLADPSAQGFGGGLVAGMDLAAEGRFLLLPGDDDTASGIDRFVYDPEAARLWWDADGAGGDDAALVAAFGHGAALSAAAIVVIA